LKVLSSLLLLVVLVPIIIVVFVLVPTIIVVFLVPTIIVVFALVPTILVVFVIVPTILVYMVLGPMVLHFEDFLIKLTRKGSKDFYFRWYRVSYAEVVFSNITPSAALRSQFIFIN
jgi:hypothetical protein